MTQQHLRGEIPAQERVRALLPSLAQSRSVLDVRRRLHRENAFRLLLDDITDFLEQELQRPRNELVRERRNDPQIARAMVAALVRGIEDGLRFLGLEQNRTLPA